MVNQANYLSIPMIIKQYKYRDYSSTIS